VSNLLWRLAVGVMMFPNMSDLEVRFPSEVWVEKEKRKEK
jgi:hypothetical protein